jgi:hypothetical protein
MGTSNFCCEICQGNRCARQENTDPMYDDECDVPNCRGGQSCAESTTVMVPQHLLYAAADAPLPATIPAFIPSIFDGYGHHPVVKLSPGPVVKKMTSGGAMVPTHQYVFLNYYEGDGSPLSVEEGESMLAAENRSNSQDNDPYGLGSASSFINLLTSGQAPPHIMSALMGEDDDEETKMHAIMELMEHEAPAAPIAPKTKYVLTYKEYCLSCWEKSYVSTDPAIQVSKTADGLNDMGNASSIQIPFTYKTMPVKPSTTDTKTMTIEK